MTNVGKDLFASYRKFKAKMVDSPSYEPLGQRVIVTSTSDAEKKMKMSEYQRKYYQEHKEKYKEYAKRSRRKHHPQKDKKGLMGMQLAIYNYLVEKTREGVDAPRGTQIARDLGITCAQVYNAVFVLVKKGYVGRYMSGRYYLTKVPEEEQITVKDLEKTYKKLYNKSKEEEEIKLKKYRKHIDGEDYSPGYVGQLKHSIKIGQKIIRELKERVIYLEEQLEKVQVVEVKEDNKSDYLKKLEDQNNKLADEVIMLRKIVKYLSKYID